MTLAELITNVIAIHAASLGVCLLGAGTGHTYRKEQRRTTLEFRPLRMARQQAIPS